MSTVEMTPREIERLVERTVRLTTIELGVIPKIIFRAEVVKKYSRKVWDNAAADLNVQTNGKSLFVDRKKFNAWIDHKLLSNEQYRTKLKSNT